MALATYNDLVASVANWLHRTDLASVIPDFVALAEARIYQGTADPQQPIEPLRLTTMEVQVSGTTGAGIGSLADLIEVRKIKIGDGLQARVLDYATRERITRLQRVPGPPQAYTIEAGTVVIGPVPDGDYPYTITYFKRFAALGPSQQTNWLLSNAPNVYLYGTLIESAPYLHDDARAAVWYRAFADAISALQSSDDRLRSSGGALRMHAA